MVEQDRNGVRENLSQQPTCQVPQISRPHPLHGVISGELRKGGVYSVTKLAEEGTPFGIRFALLGGVCSQKLYAHPRQYLPALGRVAVAVPDDDPGGTLGEFGHYRELVGVGRRYGQASDDARPAGPRTHPEAVEVLLEERVFAKGSLAGEATTTIGTSEQTCGKGIELQMAKVGS